TVADFSAAALGVTVVQGDANASANLALAAELGAAGAYTPRVDATYPVEQAAEAHARVQAGHSQGKVVLTL
ncbi:MAG: zinc-binding dehydrogenase, partial [Cellulomonas sp.]